MTTRAQLVASVYARTRRGGDVSLNSEMPQLILQMEDRIADDILHSSQVTQSALSFSGRSTTLPDDCKEIVSLTPQKPSDGPLTLMTPETIRESSAWSSAGNPCFYTVEGRSVFLAPAPSSATLDLVYYARFPQLVNDSDTTYLLSNKFSLYVMLLTAEVYSFLEDREAMLKYEALYQSLKRDVLEQDASYRSSGSAIENVHGGSYVV